MEKTVSVIIPAYNVEKYIAGCLESVCSQSYGQLQIIIVDDGSLDNTSKVAQEYSKKDNRITVLSKENGGVSSARNLAMESATGDYFFFLDSDDVLEKDAISILVTAMESTDCDWVSCQYSRHDDLGGRLEDYNFTSGEFVFSSDEDRLSFMTGTLLCYLAGFEVWDKLYRADVIRRGDIRFSEECRIGEDLAFNLKYLMSSQKLNCIPDRLVRYTIRSSSAMGTMEKLSDSIMEHSLLLSDVWKYVCDRENEFWIRNFPCIFVKVLDNTYIRHTPSEAADALLSLGDISFIRERYKDIDACREKIIGMYSPEVARIKYRYHLYVRQAVCGGYAADKIKLIIYGIYRRLKGRQPLKEWKMPY